MAEDQGQDKTEEPTQRRREEARKQGRVAVSADLTAGVLLLAAAAVLSFLGPSVAGGVMQAIRRVFLDLTAGDLTAQEVQRVFSQLFVQAVQMSGPLLGLLFVTAIGMGVLQVGFHLTPELLTLKWERLAPDAGWSKMFSAASAVRGLTAVLKLVVVAAVAYVVLKGRWGEVTRLGEGNLAHNAAAGWAVIVRLTATVAGALVVLGALDYGYQRYRLEQSLRMTREELKEEIKREEGDPQIKARIRRLQREAAQRRMLQQVPKATVVITNPAHLAVALRYDEATMGAPEVVAKGAGFVAKKIVEAARGHGVPVFERKPLAQALYKTVQVGKAIPMTLYLAVAEVLAYVYRLQGKA